MPPVYRKMAYFHKVRPIALTKLKLCNRVHIKLGARHSCPGRSKRTPNLIYTLFNQFACVSTARRVYY